MSLVTKQLSVGYGKRVLINDVTLSIEGGQILCLIGPNGAGKSTILKTITRQLKDLGGDVLLVGKDMKEMSVNEVAKTLSMVMTDRLHPELMTCREVVATGRYPYTGTLGILSEEDWAKVDEAMALVHADETRDMDFMQISDGQKQRVMLARALCQEPKVLVLDEPTSFLDMRFKLEILENISKLVRTRNIAVIMSVHELELAEKIADTIACVDGDKVSMVGRPREVFQGDYIQSLYGLKPECFDPLTGHIFFEGSKNTPKVFVISGGGSGIHAFSELQRREIPFAAGILGKEDMEYRFAVAGASQVLAKEWFSPCEEKLIEEGKALIDTCDACVCVVEHWGPLNDYNRILLEYARDKHKLVDMEMLWQK